MEFNNFVTTLPSRELEAYYFAFIVMGALFLFIKTNKMFDVKVRRLFYGAIISVFIAAIVDGLLVYFKFVSTSNLGATVFHSLKYIMLPQIVLFLFFIVKSDFKKIDVLLFIPQIINIVVSFSSLFIPIAFTYNESHLFVRGPLGFVPHFAGLFYQCCTFYETLRFFKQKNYLEGMLLLYIIVGETVAVILDVIMDCRLAISASAAGVAFFYLYFQTQTQRRDCLTNAYNRQAFYLDANKYKKDICALIGFDLNDLKLINDTHGHAAGDLALITLAKVINNQLTKNSRLYRTGGDEFVVLCRKQTEEQVMLIMEKVKEQMKDTDYRCAVGVSFAEEQTDIDTMYKLADQKMYDDKMIMKSGRNYREKQR